MKEGYSVLILGAGKIGAFFDTPDSSSVLTHAHAFTSHSGFRLLGFVDIEKEQADRAAALWGGEAFPSLEDALARHRVDVVVVAVPDEFHYAFLRKLAGYPLRLVFAEKPLTKHLAEAEEISTLYRDRGISLALNYTRRFVPEFLALKDEIASGSYGRLLSGTGYYGKGTLHNCSHLIDLIRFMLGEIIAATTLGTVRDCYLDDPSCSAWLTLASGGNFVLQAVDCRYCTIFEIDLIFEQRRIRIVDGGFKIETYQLQESNLFAGYRNLTLAGVHDSQLGNGFKLAASAIHAHILDGTPLPCTDLDGIAAQKLCTMILEQAA